VSTDRKDVSTVAAPNSSRAARMRHPRLITVLQDLAVEHGVCVRPLPMRRVDLTTGRSEVIDVPCGSTRASKCPSCAAKAKRLRQVQCRQGWHRTDEPIQPEPASDGQRDLVTLRAELEWGRARAEQLGEWAQADDLSAQIEELEEQITLTGLRGRAVRPTIRRVRSTKRRQDTPNLPRRKVANRTIGRVYIGRDGSEHRSSMFVTTTLGSYGPVRRSDSTPVDMDTYDYRRAALDAVHFPALLDRFWQNLRRAVGWNVQYFGCVEPQRRLAPHAHYAVRGSFPRATFRQVAAGTYQQVWQPSTDVVVFGEDGPQPEWHDDGELPGYISPWTGQQLQTWQQAMDALDEQIEAGEVGPAHVVRFGDQVHAASNDSPHDDLRQGDRFPDERPMGVEGMEAGTIKAEKAIGYITKYITKSVDECHQRTTDREIEHHRRFHEALRFTPCSPRCANWLRYGIQPQHARPGLVAGRCRGKVHQPATLGIGGRRILVSRDWSGKTLADHKADQTAWVRRVLALGIGHTTPQGLGADGQAGDVGDGRGDELVPDTPTEVGVVAGGNPPVNVRWEPADARDKDVKPLHQRLWRLVGERLRRRAEWQTAYARLTPDQLAPPDLLSVSAT
jgi:hypothetical protein